VQSADGMVQGVRHGARRTAFGVRCSVFGFQGAGCFDCGLQIADFGLRGKVQSAEGMAQRGRSKVRGVRRVSIADCGLRISD